MNDPLVEQVFPWLTPVSAERPAGAPVDADPLYATLMASIGEAERAANADVAYAAWLRASTAGKEILRTRSKDLRVATHVAWAEMHLSPSEGFARGVTLLTELMERYGDTLFPAASAASERADSLGWFVERARRRIEAPSGSSLLSLGASSVLVRFEEVVRRRLGGDALPLALQPLRALVERREGTSLLDDILGEANIPTDLSGYDIVKTYGAAPFLDSVRANLGAPRCDVAAVDAQIARIDKALSAQVGEILNHPAFQRLEAAWRSVKFLVDRVDFRAGVQVEVFSVSKPEILQDLARGAANSRLHDLVRRQTFERGGSHPYALLVVDHEFDSSEEDVAGLEGLATLAALAHAQCLTAPMPSVLGLASWRALPGWRPPPSSAAHGLTDTGLSTEGDERWRALRALDASQHLSLCLPRFRLRPRYGAATAPVKAFSYEETAASPNDGAHWGSAAVLVTAAICDAFAGVGWHLPRMRYQAAPPEEGTTHGGTARSLAVVECELSPRKAMVLDLAGLTYFDVTPPKDRARGDHALLNVGSVCHQREPLRLSYLFLYLAMARCVQAQYHGYLRQGVRPEEVERALDAWVGRLDRSRDDGRLAVRRCNDVPFQRASLSIEIRADRTWIAHLSLCLSHDVAARPYLRLWSLSQGGNHRP